MNITAREQKYLKWQQDWQQGKIDEATFIAAVDDLAFQDEQGYQWMLGAETGRWYFLDGQTWRQADPPRSEPVAAAGRQQSDYPPKLQGNKIGLWGALPGFASLLVVPIRSALIVGVAFLVVLALVWPVVSAPLEGNPAVAPSPRPPLGSQGGDNGGGSGGGGGSSGGGSGGGSSNVNVVRQSSIIGTVADINTGLPAAGVEVSVSGQIVRTDTDGSYSITGLAAGEYTVMPVNSGPSVYVSVDGVRGTTVNLAYYGPGQPLPTDTPQPSSVTVIQVSAQATPPPALPNSGAPIAPKPFVFIGIGLLLTLAGGFLLSVHKLNLPRNRES